MSVFLNDWLPSLLAVMLLAISFIWRLIIVLTRLNSIELDSENFKEVFEKFSSRLLELVYMFFSHFFAMMILFRIKNIPYGGIFCFFFVIFAITAFVIYVIEKVIKK